MRDGYLDIYHADETKPPTKVNLLTCQMKPVPEDRLSFDVVSYNRTYHFQVGCCSQSWSHSSRDQGAAEK